jgi:hypothetical protein
MDDIRALVAVAKEYRIRRLVVDGVEIEFAEDAFRPAAPERQELTQQEREAKTHKQLERRRYGSSVG